MSKIPDLLAAAKKEPKRSIRGGNTGTLAYIMPVVHELRGRNFTWNEIVEWLADHGHKSSKNGLQPSYSRYRRGLTGNAGPLK